MSVHPQLLPFRDQLPNLELTRENLAPTRLVLNRMSLEGAAAVEGFEHIEIEDRQIDGPSPGQSLRLRLYSGASSAGGRPCLLWIHGGGYIVGCPEMDEQLLCRKADELGCLVVAVDYRLAPEHPYPAALDDCDAALGWIHGERLGAECRYEHAGGGRGQRRRRASGGAGLARPRAAARRNRLSVPDLSDARSPHRRFSGGKGQGLLALERRSQLLCLGCLPGFRRVVQQSVSHLASPALAQRLAGLPPAYLCIGDQDLFYEEDLEYARRLRESGIEVELEVVPGAPHGFDKFPAPLSEQSLQRRIKALARHFSGKG